jgi:inositol oxygenase
MSGPLEALDQWDDFVKGRYQPGKDQTDFRVYDDNTPDVVKQFYRLNHTNQTREFVLRKKEQYGGLRKGERGIWESLVYLDSVVDDSDPDTDLTQVEHAVQTAEAIRADGHPRWMILTGLIHDLGKVLCSYGEAQWAVVGDTFPVACAFSNKIVFPEYFAANPDAKVPEYQTKLGLYKENCGLRNVDLSWGHDEYLYVVTRAYLPEPAQYMIRYHSFYPGHRERAYDFLMDDHDREMFAWVRAFNPYDLYSKGAGKPDVEALTPYYKDLIGEFFPPRICW